MDNQKHCDECKKEYDFENHASGWCKTCGKKYLCLDCYDIHECLPGKSRHLILITNPKWISRLVNTQAEELKTATMKRYKKEKEEVIEL